MFRRRNSSDREATAGTEGTEAKLGGKGRATPSRKESQAARKKRMTAPRTRKEASARQRERTKSDRTKMRSAMDTGDDRYLPTRDKGPVKRYIRDYVDSHRTVGQYLIPAFFVIFVLVYFNTGWAASVGSSAWLVVIVAMAADSFRIRRGVKRGIVDRFGADEAKGTTMYTLMRAWQMRRLRLPKPQVKPGDKI